MSTAPDQVVRRYFDAPGGAAVKALSDYFAAGMAFTGSAFDRMIASSPSDRFTADDIVAVSMLSVNVPPRAANALLSGGASDLLRAIPAGASVWANPELLDRGEAASQLWDSVARFDGCGMTITSKILAAKRPNLVPIYDQHVARGLGHGESYWEFWQQVAVAGNSSGLPAAIEAAREAAGVSKDVSSLRIVDVVVWMAEIGRD